MPILNYTTKIDPWKTVNEIQQILAKHGVSHFGIKNQGSFPVGLSFTIEHEGRPLNFLLPCNYMGVLAALRKDKKAPLSAKNEPQALRIAWRIIKDWVQAQLALIASEQATAEVIFMPYLIGNNGKLLHEVILEGDGLKLLK